MATRLDRLLLLLDTGSTPLVRRAAAVQLGEVIKYHPHELYNLISRVHVHLRSRSWDTRVAAGQAIDAIARNSGEWRPSLPEGAPAPAEKTADDLADLHLTRLSFDNFDFERVLSHGAPLLSSSGREYDIDWSEMTAREKLAIQKQRLLGLDLFADFNGQAGGISADDLVKDDDLTAASSAAPKHAREDEEKVKRAAMVADEINNTSNLSARERNRLKRLARTKSAVKAVPTDRLLSRTRSTGVDAGADAESSSSTLITEQPNSDAIVVESKKQVKLLLEQSDEWPFAAFCEMLCHDLFDPVWQIRHGAGVGLREVLKSHGATAGMRVDLDAEANAVEHERWLEDAAIRLICVFALDRFSDFVADQVVTPVRETCAQALGVLLGYMSERAVGRVQAALIKLAHNNLWEIRHGGYLGLRYIAAVRTDLMDQMLQSSYPVLLKGIPDADDDVRATAASALLPVVDGLVRMPPTVVHQLLRVLDEALLKLDDLTASTASVIDLVAALLGYPSVHSALAAAPVGAESGPPALCSLVEHLFPFFRHPVHSVRRAVLQMMKRLLESYDNHAWLHSLAPVFLRLIFQNLLLEENPEVHRASTALWESVIERVPAEVYASDTLNMLIAWHGTLRTPIGHLFDASLFHIARHSKEDSSGSAASKEEAESPPKPAAKRRRVTSAIVADAPSRPTPGSAPAPDRALYDIIRASDITLVPPELIYQNREAAATAYGHLLRHIGKAEQEQIVRWLQQDIESDVAFHRQVGYIVIAEWASPVCEPLCASLQQRLSDAVKVQDGGIVGTFVDLQPVLLRLRAECAALLASFVSNGVPANKQPKLPEGAAFTVDIAYGLLREPFDELLSLLPPRQSAQERQWVLNDLEARRKNVTAAIVYWANQARQLHRSVNSLAAVALLALGKLPDSFNTIVKPLMSSIESETLAVFQRRSCEALASLMLLCVDRTPSPNDRIARNTCKMICGTTFANAAGGEHGLLSYVADKEDKTADVRQSNGADHALAAISSKFGDQLFVHLPVLWDVVRTPLERSLTDDAAADAQSFENQQPLLSDALSAVLVTRILLPALHPSLLNDMVPVASLLVRALRCPCSALRTEACKTLAVFCRIAPAHAMPLALNHIVAALTDAASVVHRRGAAELILHILREMESAVLSYAVLLLVPAMERMSDQDTDVRLVCAASFAELVKLVPLDAGSLEAPGLDAALMRRRENSREFIEQLLHAGKAQAYRIPVTIHAQLRAYQQEGVNWLAFLRRYHLNGILCDDMGLGKTLQSICMLASAHHEKQSSRPVSLVVCPTTVTGHWEHEIKRFSGGTLSTVVYAGQPNERKRLVDRLRTSDVVIASYDILRNDVAVFKGIPFLYCILDEGHIIKNAKSKTSQAVKVLTAEHRLILTGTPIQNNVVELWALFDFLMPGFLGSQRQFNDRYGKPIFASGDPKASSKEQEAGALALEALHKQVLPFILRRMKTDVLHDLPPKIIQDYVCELTPLQRVLYESFSREQKPEVGAKVKEEPLGEEELAVASAGGETQAAAQRSKAMHVFQALQYLRKVCDHPLLVLTPEHPRRKELLGAGNVTAAASVEMSTKMAALKDLLQQCGIGSDADADHHGSSSSSSHMTAADIQGVVGRHRALIFCQFKGMIDIIERDLLKPMGSSVAWLRLDGTVAHHQRQSVVNKFNEDPSVDLLLLTTQVGGVGLNLTGADTVIFMEHDWNPQKDVQAMDRAHRIGQKSVVNVYRLITKGTLEEKIMGLQTFKLKIANSIVNADNKSLQSMSTEQLLDLFELSSANAADEVKVAAAGAQDEAEAAAGDAAVPAAARGVLSNLEALWNEDQYAEEYELDSFLKSIGRGKE